MSRTGLLFDLDGTLADTAPDLVAVLNRLLAEQGRAPVPFAVARNYASHGAVGLIRLGFGLSSADEVDEALRLRFLELYSLNGHNYSSAFLPLETLLSMCSRIGARWGIVTNKPAAFTEPLLEHLGLRASASTVISGDTLPVRKPDPAPLRLAAAELGIDCANCIYLGDAERDIAAGRAAGMRTISTSYGYLRPSDDALSWQADATVDHPSKIPSVVLSMANVS